MDEIGIVASAQLSGSNDGGDVPDNVLTLGGDYLTLGGDYLVLVAEA